MSILAAVLLGVLQGLTEFFPVSSSGHLVVAQAIIPGFKQPGVLFDVVLHAGTLLAILIYYWKILLKLDTKYYFYIIIATLPAIVVGLLLGDIVEKLFTSTTVVGFAFLFTALLNFFTDRNLQSKGKKLLESSNFDVNSLVIGAFQAFAMIPGISRSGSTIFAGTKFKLSAREAAKFSFLLSVPAIIGANIVQFAKYSGDTIIEPVYYLVGFTAAMISGYFAIGWVVNLLEKKKFRYFAYYCAALGMLVLLLP